MADARDILNRGLALVEKQVMMLEKVAEERTMLPVEREDLVAYMSLLRQLIGKDLGGDEDVKSMSEEELLGLLDAYKKKD